MIKFITTQSVIDSPFIVEHTIENLLAWMQEKQVYGVDTETTGEWNMKNQILSLQIGDTQIQWVIDWQSISRRDKNTILTEMAKPDTTKVLQNAKFDLKFFFQKRHYLQNIFDVMVAECLIHAGKEMEKGSFALDTLAEKYTELKLDKSVRGVIHREGLSNRVIEYAAKDVECILPIMHNQHKQLIELGMANTNHQDELTVLGIENRACLCLALMEFNGIKLDVDKWKSITADLAEEIIRLEEELDKAVFSDSLFFGIGKRQMDLFGGTATGINWKSPQQKLELLQRINPEIENTSERAVAKHKHEHPIIPLMQRYIKMNKLYTGFALTMLKMINKHTGRIHTNFWQNLKTGRTSASSPNLLQIPARTEEGGKMRSAFIAESGYKIVGGDLGGAELRVLTEASKDPVWLDIFNSGKDLHSELCARTFNISLDKVKEISPYGGIKYRDIQKTINFGIAYGMGEHKLADMLQIPVEDAKAIISKFLGAVPVLNNFLNRMASYSVNAKKSITLPPYRRIRWLPWSESWEIGGIERQGKNHVPQGSNADWIKCALGRVYYYIVQNNLQQDIKPILQVYDEIQTECKEELAEQWRQKLEEIMVQSGQIIIKSIPVVADCKISDCWSK